MIRQQSVLQIQKAVYVHMQSKQILPFGFARQRSGIPRHRHTVGSMLVQRLRRWPNIGPPLCGCLSCWLGITYHDEGLYGAMPRQQLDYLVLSTQCSCPGGLSIRISADNPCLDSTIVQSVSAATYSWLRQRGTDGSAGSRRTGSSAALMGGGGRGASIAPPIEVGGGDNCGKYGHYPRVI